LKFLNIHVAFQDIWVDVNQINYDEETPLHRACEKGQIEVVKLLLMSERVVIDLSKENKYRTTPIDIAREGGEIEQQNWQSDQEFQKKKRDHEEIVELLESFENEPNETRFKLKIQLGLIGKITFLFLYFYYY